MMGNFLGTLGGLLMAVLVIVLAIRFLLELGIKWEGKELAGVLSTILVTGLLLLGSAGIYYTVKISQTSILNITTIWGKESLVFSKFFPFNWYVCMGLGILTFWNIYYLSKKVVGKEKAYSFLIFTLCLPGGYLLFLPLCHSLVTAVVSTAVVVLFRYMKNEWIQKIKEVSTEYTDGFMQRAYPLFLVLCALANGVHMMMRLGG